MHRTINQIISFNHPVLPNESTVDQWGQAANKMTLCRITIIALHHISHRNIARRCRSCHRCSWRTLVEIVYVFTEVRSHMSMTNIDDQTQERRVCLVWAYRINYKSCINASIAIGRVPYQIGQKKHWILRFLIFF